MNAHLKLLGLGFICLAAFPGSFFVLGFLLGSLQYSVVSALTFALLLVGLSYCVGFTVNKIKG